ncbi:hypothetical protein [Acidocella sp.]|uniref:hypothetical protein n=1 Tax=Acidocella sp. TaxID=50710 RepID=UPI003D0497A5
MNLANAFTNSGSLSNNITASTPVDSSFLPGTSPSVMAWMGPAAQMESGNSATAQNPGSSASGLYQFTDGTWDGLVNQYGKQYGLTASGKSDPKQQRIAAQLIAQNEYLPALQSAGITNPSPDDIEQVHFWGVPQFQKLVNAGGPNVPLKDALGSEFDSVYAANKDLFGNNPNITVGQAGAAVDAHMPAGRGDTAMLPPSLGGSYAGTGQTLAGQQPSPEMPNAQTPPGAGGPPPGAQGLSMPGGGQMPQPQVGSRFSPWQTTLLRMAAGAAGGGSSFLGGLAGAAGALTDGQQADYANQMKGVTAQQNQRQLNQQDAYRQGMLGLAQQKNKLDVIQSAAALAQMGFDPNLAMQAASGGMSQQQVAQALAKGPKGLGKVSAGDTWMVNGVSYTQENRQYGPPVFYNNSTGQVSPTLPAGAVRAQDPGSKIGQTDDANAEQALFTQAQGAKQTDMDAALINQVLPQVSTGSSLGDVLSRNITQLTGKTGVDAQQTLSTLLTSLQGSQLQAMRGLGKLDLPEVNNALKSGANIMQNPTALKAILAWKVAQGNYSTDEYDAWNNASDQDRAQGFRRWSYNYEKQNPLTDYVKGYIQQNAPDLMGQEGSAASGNSGPSNGGGQPSLSSFWSK